MTGLPAYVQLVRAPNPGPMTLDGTNTWLVGDPTLGPPLVVDPGPAIETHLAAVLAAAGGRLAGIVLTHRHLDHSESAADLARRADCGVRALDPQLRIGADDLEDGRPIEVGGVTLTPYATPGHTSDSCSLLLRGPAGAWLLTGDTVLGRGTSVITHPDGNLGAYLTSLDRLQRLVAEEAVVALLPGHGPLVDEPAVWLTSYQRHRHERLEQVRTALEALAAEGVGADVAQLADRVYAGLDPAVRPAVEQSIQAQLVYLSSFSANS